MSGRIFGSDVREYDQVFNCLGRSRCNGHLKGRIISLQDRIDPAQIRLNAPISRILSGFLPVPNRIRLERH